MIGYLLDSFNDPELERIHRFYTDDKIIIRIAGLKLYEGDDYRMENGRIILNRNNCENVTSDFPGWVTMTLTTASGTVLAPDRCLHLIPWENGEWATLTKDEQTVYDVLNI